MRARTQDRHLRQERWLDAVARFLNGVASRGTLGLVGLATVGRRALSRQWRRLVVFLIGLVVLARRGPRRQSTPPDLVRSTSPRSERGRATPLHRRRSPGSSSSSSEPPTCSSSRGAHAWSRSWRSAALAVGVGLARVELGLDRPSDVVFGLILGVAITVGLFRIAPNDVFPVRYGRRGKTAHLDVGGRRGEEIHEAMKKRLGLTGARDQAGRPGGLGGFDALRMRVVDEESATRSVFAKLYAENHVRADYWYKLGRLMLYGRLETRRHSRRCVGSWSTRTTAPPGARVRHLDARRARHRGDHAGARVPDRDGVLRRRGGGGRGLRSTIRSSTRVCSSSTDVGRGAGAPRHQARQPHGAGRSPPADRRLLRSGAAVAIAAGHRSREHDARAGATVGRGDRVWTCAPTPRPEELAEAFAEATRGVASPSPARRSIDQDGRTSSGSSGGSHRVAGRSRSSAGARVVGWR